MSGNDNWTFACVFWRHFPNIRNTWPNEGRDVETARYSVHLALISRWNGGCVVPEFSNYSVNIGRLPMRP